MASKKSSSSDGRWVTINGVHVFIGASGKITKGPAKFIGSKVDDLKGQKMSDEKKAQLKAKYGDKKKSTSTTTSKSSGTTKKTTPTKSTTSKTTGTKSTTSKSKDPLDIAIKNAEKKYGAKVKEADIRREYRALTGRGLASDVRVLPPKAKQTKSTTTKKSTGYTEKYSGKSTKEVQSALGTSKMTKSQLEAQYEKDKKYLADPKNKNADGTIDGKWRDAYSRQKAIKKELESRGTTTTLMKETKDKTKANEAVSKYRDESTTPFGKSKESKSSNTGQVVSTVRSNINGGLQMTKAFGLKMNPSEVSKMQDYFDKQAMSAAKRGAKVVGSKSSPFSGQFSVEFSDGTIATYQIKVN